MEPFAALAYVHVGTGGFTESGPIAGLTTGGLDMNLGYGTLGARAGTTWMWGVTTVRPHASLAWQYAFGDTTPEQALAFASTGMGIGGVPHKSFDDQTIRMVDMKRFDLDAKEIMRLPTASETQPVVDMSGKFLAKKTAAAAE